MKTKLFEGEVNNEYPLRRWLELYNEGAFETRGYYHFEKKSRAIDAGAFDWWNNSAFDWVARLGKKIAEVAKSGKIDIDNMYVFYKQNCPMVGRPYDCFKICDIENGNVLYCIDHLPKGTYGEDFSGWEIWDFTPDGISGKTHGYAMRGNWREVKKWFGI